MSTLISLKQQAVVRRSLDQAIATREDNSARLNAARVALAAQQRRLAIARPALPLIALCLLALVFLWPSASPVIEPLPEDNAPQATMVAPVYTGVDGQNRPFRATADTATQPPSAPQALDAAAPRATLDLGQGEKLFIQSQQGRYIEQDGLLLLQGAVQFSTTQEQYFNAQSLQLDLKNNRAWSEQPVSAHNATGRIESQKFSLEEGGKIVVFSGGAKAVLNGARFTPDKDTPKLPPKLDPPN